MANSTDHSSVPAHLPLGVTAVMLPELGFDDQLALCQKLGVTHMVLRPRVIADDQRDQPYSNWGNHAFDLTPQRLVDEGPAIAAKLADAGMTPFGTVPTLTLDQPDDAIDLACRGAIAVGATSVRLCPAGAPQKLYDWPKLLDQLRGRLRDAVNIADQVQRQSPDAKQIKFTFEIHTGLPTPTAGLTRAVLEPFDPDRVGAILDLPNLAREGLTAPAVSISVLGPYLDHCHVGGARREPNEPDAQGFTGSHTTFTSLRESDLHIPTWLRLIAEHADALGRDIPLICEDYTPNLPGTDRLTRTVQEIHDAFA